MFERQTYTSTTPGKELGEALLWKEGQHRIALSSEFIKSF